MQNSFPCTCARPPVGYRTQTSVEAVVVNYVLQIFYSVITAVDTVMPGSSHIALLFRHIASDSSDY